MAEGTGRFSGEAGSGAGEVGGWSCCRVCRSNKGTGAAGAEESGRTVGPPRSSRTGDAANEAKVLTEGQASEGEGAAGAGLTEASAGSCCHAVSQGQGCKRRRLSGKESACSAGGPGPTPGSGGSPGEGHGYPLQYALPGEFHTLPGIAKRRTQLSRHAHKGCKRRDPSESPIDLVKAR